MHHREPLYRFGRWIGAVAAVAATIGAAGCSESNTQRDAPAAAAVTWVEAICAGEYGKAHDMTAEFMRIDPAIYPQFIEELEQAEALADTVISDLGASDAAAEIAVVEVRTPYGDSDPSAADVELAGTCLGEPFAHIVEVIHTNDQWQISEPLPLWETNELFNRPGYDATMPLDFSRGQRIHPADPAAIDRWLLLPGKHSVELPAHFLTGPATRTTVTVNAFSVVDHGYLPSWRRESLDAAFESFVSDCGDVCLVRGGTENSALPLSIEPVMDAEVTYSEDALLVRPTGIAPEWQNAQPSWGDGGPNGATAQLRSTSLEMQPLTCPEGEACAVSLDTDRETVDVHLVTFVESGDAVLVGGVG
ncbi:hypothetical protein [Gulosibacter molinativorax]|uniref:DUF4878 domain-containing protein n=1 Tax=Gulosibacter molinativorax TaxID=256821 RepID=A0ABT7C8E5_9MICO|nr:hypothetical protein [Gulosibacter molinativorax]MDJ1371478.1 hypothetical protein [Gulosibacter molinativorax]QUY62418.1 Hypotetical protein [Gulosibacter molinativorax]